MKTLVVSQYYAPETGATQNRMTAFVDGLRDRGHEVTVLCEQPNHPAGEFQPGFGSRPVVSAREGGVTVHRLWVAASPHKTTARRLAFYGTFAGAAGAAAAVVPRPDVVFASSPPLPGPFAVAAVVRARRIPFVLDVRDLWPAAAEALGELSNPAIMARLEHAERWLYRHARTVTATTLPFCRHIDAVAGRRVAVHLPNGALDQLLTVAAPPRAAGPFVLGYVGNLGIAQGLGIALDAAERLRKEDVVIRLVGEGPLREELTAEISRRGLEGVVELQRGVPVAEVGTVLEGMDALLIPLRAHDLLGDFIPSKLYDAMAVGRPAIVAAGREAAALVEETGCGIAIAPEDGDALAQAVRGLAADPAQAQWLGAAGRAAAPRFVRSGQVERLDHVLRAVAGAA